MNNAASNDPYSANRTAPLAAADGLDDPFSPPHESTGSPYFRADALTSKGGLSHPSTLSKLASGFCSPASKPMRSSSLSNSESRARIGFVSDCRS